MERVDEKLENFYELFERRKSVREFQDRPIAPEVLARLLETLRRAQSAANRQPWRFIVVEKKDRAELNDALTKEGFRGAPIIIAACAEPKEAWTRKADRVNYAWVDVTIAVTEMICAATAEGLGTCWIASLEPAGVKKILGIPEDTDIVALIAIGWPNEELKREEKARKPLEEIIRYGKWQG